MLKNTRDYSFLLSDDAEPPAPAKDPPPQNVAVSRPEARLDQVPLKSKQLSSNNCQKMFNAGEEWRYMPTNRKMESKVGPHKLASRSRPMSPMDRKQHGRNNGSGPGRPQAPKGIPSKVPLTSTEKKIISSSAKNFIPVMRKPLVSKSQPSIPKQTLDRRWEFQESSKGKFLSRQQVSSKPQIKQPSTKVPSHGTSQRDYPEKRPIRHYSDDYEDEEGGEAISMIRRMFGYNPNKFTDEGDDSDMEANFNDILKEERRSEKIAQKEDEEELRKIEEEDRRGGLRKVAKKRKLSSLSRLQR